MLILAGSGQFLLSRDDDTEKFIQKKMKPLIDYVVDNEFPTLGACFGGQLIGIIRGGEIKNDPLQAEAGIQHVNFTDPENKDPLFNGVDDTIHVAMGHEDSLVKLPSGAKHLACSSKCNLQAYRIGNNVYGVQFHPELDDNDLYERLQLYEHYDKYDLGHDIPDVIHGPQILKNFASLFSD